MDYIVVFITCLPKEGEKIADILLKEKLAACVNITSKLKSFFWWEGKIDKEEEILLIVKTKKEKLDNLIDLVKRNHSYTVPEIIALPIIGGNKDYLNWIETSI